ncbi:MAG: sigma-70 family RNA polymerase sigma factor [Clostridiales bacterium]|jgi:RNA polymerase sigma-70 factor (ECF subfamily)|nr:sigma-70 family RNA polymerase sigma factor [Clostridiales bacterium]
MIDMLLLSGVKGGSEDALGKIIDKYNAYVCTVIQNTAGESLTREDVEETAEDVFLALWDSASKVQKLKQWLAGTARNKAISKFRKVAQTIPLDDDIQLDNGNGLDNAVIEKSERVAVRQAILSMGEPDSEIFLRHYYGSQTVTAIAAETDMTEAAIKHRLVRGREKLRLILGKEVFSYE